MDYFLNKIDKHMDNHMNLDQRMTDLKRKLKELNGLKEDTESTMSVELRPRKKLKAEVQIWLENVGRINGQVQDLDGRIGESSALTRGFHAEDVLESKRQVSELIIQQGKFHGDLLVDNPQWIGQVLSTTSLSGEAVEACVEEIWRCSMDDEVRKIGVWGMGGVGKTSIMKVINNQLLKEMARFDIVIWITVSKEMNIAKLQDDIACKLGVTFSGDKDEITRAGILCNTLSQKIRFVMILDDLWEKVSLERIGIPEPSAGSKLVLTTRSYDVCRQVGCRVIKVNPLTEEEAWKLFLEKVGRDIFNIPGVEQIAKSIAKRCAGLPLGVITIASCMKGIDDICEWRNALKELSLRHKSVNGFEYEVFHQLRFSYDCLKDPKLKQCFLCCALFPEDEAIEEENLVQLWIAEGLVEEMDNIQAEFDRGRAIMNRLVSNSLLEVFSEKEYARTVKMHDLLRDMALHIAESRFLVKAGTKLEKPLYMQEWSKDLEKVSLMMTPLYIPSQMSPPKCPRLTTLLLSHCGITSIPKGFFKHMDALKVLDLTSNPFENLPNSLSNCSMLTTLLLSLCNIRSIPEGFFKYMDALKVLDLKWNPLENLPNSLSNCSMLTTLLLFDCDITIIPGGFFKHMDAFKVLNLTRNPLENLPNSFSNCSMLTKLLLSDCDITSIPEGFFKHMDALEVLDLTSNPLENLPNYLSKCSMLTKLLLSDCDITSIPEGFFKHMDALEVLDLTRNPLENLPNSLSNCSMLTKLLLSLCNIRSIPEGFFKHMDALKVLDLKWNPLENLPNSLSNCSMLTTLLLSSCNIGSIPEDFFKHMDALKVLDLSGNPIESLPISLSNLKNLNSLLLAYCKYLKNVPSLSNLGFLKKLDLQRTKIKEIPPGMENLVSLEYLEIGETLISGKEVGGLKKLEYFEGRFSDWDNLNMYLQALQGREGPLRYIISVGDAVWDDMDYGRQVIVVSRCNIYSYQIMLPCDIDGLEIGDCRLDGSEGYPLFSSFMLFSLVSFSSLTYISIEGCTNMKRLFSPNCVPLNLQRLGISKCNQLEEIIASEVESGERGMVTMEYRLPRLRVLVLWGLPELKRICGVGGVVVCDSLEDVRIKDCLKLERMGLNLPQFDNVPPSAPTSLSIWIQPKEWWESVEWDAKPLLEPIFLSKWEYWSCRSIKRSN